MATYELQKFNSPEMLEPEYRRKEAGCFVRVTTGFILVFLALILVAGVAAIVYFVQKDNLQTTNDDPQVTSGSAEKLKSECEALAESGKLDQNKVCTVCPTQAPATCPTWTTKLPVTSLSTSTPSSTTPPVSVDFRLPNDVIPLEYDVTIKPYMSNGNPDSFFFGGNVKIKIECKTPTNKVILHGNMLKISNVKFGAIDDSKRTLPAPEFDPQRQFLTFRLNEFLQTSKTYELSIDFRGPLKNDMKGLYLSSYSHGGQTRYLATTQFQPTDARKAFPCFDEPGFKANFSVRIIRPKGWTSLSNMNIRETLSHSLTEEEDVYHTSPKMSSYLVAFVVSQFQSRQGTFTNGKPYLAWAQPAAYNETEEALNVGVSIIQKYEDFFNIEFPLPKQEMIAIPDYPLGAMENWGLITYRETAMLYNKEISSEASRQRVTQVITHELSHQWFGNLVTMRWWDDLWLNEGFATFIEYFGADMVHPELKMLEKFTVSEMFEAFDMDGLTTSHPIYVPVESPDQINEIFDHIIYNKGGSVIRMLRFFMGEQTFLKGLQDYLQSKKYSTAFHDDLFDALDQRAQREGVTFPASIKDIMDTWISQMNYPVVKVTKSSAGAVHVQQKRFLVNDASSDPGKFVSKFNYQWKIPFTFKTSKDVDFNVTNSDVHWIMSPELDIQGSVYPSNQGDWILGNVQQYGFYRVNYDTDNWRALMTQLKQQHTRIPLLNRAQLINDAWNLVKAGELSVDVALPSLEYLDAEFDYVPWVSAMNEVGYLSDMLGETEAYGDFQMFMKEKLSKLFKKLTLDDSNSTHIETLLRSLVGRAACSYSISSCVTEASRLFSAWMEDPQRNRIDPDIKNVVYCTGIREGGQREWEFAYTQYKTTTVASEKSLLLSALSCSSQTWLLSHYLKLSLDPNEIRSQDVTNVIIYVSRNSVGRYIAWEFLQENWETLRQKFGSGFFKFAQLIKGVTESFNTGHQLRQLEDFVRTHPDLGTGQRAFQEAIENTKANKAWMETNYATIKTWLEKMTSGSSVQKLTDVRLPRSNIPTLYDIYLKPDIYSGDPTQFKFYGRITISFECVGPTTNITLHKNKLTVSDIQVSNQNAWSSAPRVAGQSEDKDRQFLIIHLDGSLQRGQNYTVAMNFVGELTDDLTGLYLSSYMRDDQKVYMATTQMEPTDARKAFPCFDEPDLKARFKLTLARKPDKISLSNMPIIEHRNSSDGFVEDVYQVSEKMSTYLVCIIVCDFVSRTGTTKNNIKYSAWSTPEAYNQTVLALDVGMTTITYYEEFFGIAFPLPKQDMIAIPDFAAGAMENWGLITYRETAMLYQPGVSSETNKQRVVTVITHELAHQWFGDLVTMEWWDDLWLNEGFATFVEYLGADNKYPEWKMFEQFTVAEVQAAFGFDGLVSSHPIYAPVYNPAEINEIFDTISYSKGGSIIRMMQWFLGDNTFKNGLKRYLDNRKYGNAAHNDLWNAMSQQAVQDGQGRVTDVKQVMDTWTLQMNYPVVMVTVVNGQVRVQQKRFLQNPTARDPMKYTSPFGYMWQIPFTYTTKTQANFNQNWANAHWFNTSQKDLPRQGVIDANDWIIGNVQQYGYYRVNYDKNNWLKLVQQLKTDHASIHVINRGQLINDAWALAKSGDADMEVALKMVEYLGSEMDYVPWYAARHELSYVQKMLTRSNLYGKFKNFMQTLIKKPYDKLGMDNSGSGHLEIYTRSLLVGEACSYDIESCMSGALRMYQDWMDDPINKRVDPDLKSAVYCTAIAEGGEAEWNFAYQQYKETNVAAERRTLMAAMACTKQTWILSKYLSMSLDSSEVRRQDGTYVIIYVSRNSVGRDLAWNFVKANFDQLLEMYGTSAFALKNLLNGVLDSFNTEQDLQQLRDFKQKYPDMGSGTRAFDQVMEKTVANIEWMTKYYSIIEKWLDDNMAAASGGSSLKDVRLPRSVLPELYTLELFPDIYQPSPENFTFSGNVTILVNVVNNTNNITLHINKLTVNPNSVRVMKSSDFRIVQTQGMKEDKERQFLIIFLNQPLQRGEKYEVSMSFVGPLTDDLAGLYYSAYKRGDQPVYLATTQMEPVDARKSFPCFDEPDMKAKFKVTLLRRPEKISLSNMRIERTESRSNGLLADVYEESVPMSTYLACFIVCDFQNISKATPNGIMYGAWSRPEAIHQAEFALDVGVDTITFYEDYFNISFPLKKQDMIAIPDFAAGAMENWGLITYRETAMLYDPVMSSESNKQRVVVVITHELAHQWFGDLVTMGWWDDLWLNEGFASFVEYLGADHKFPEWKMFDQFVTEDLQVAFEFDGLVSSHPIYVPVANPDEINEIFDKISYSKGGSVIRMMRFYLGEDTFRAGLTDYLNSKRYGNSFHDDLWNSMTKLSKINGHPVDVKAVMDTWTLQMNYPVVTVTRLDNGHLRVTQKRFLSNPQAQDPLKYTSQFGYKWTIPFTYTMEATKRFNQTYQDMVWFNASTQDIPANVEASDWILGNVQVLGYYRMNYDLDNWNKLIGQLKANHEAIYTTNRAQLINDAWALAKAGELPMEIALQTMEYLGSEMDYVPWQAAQTELSYVRKMLVRTSLYGKYKNFMSSLLKKPFDKLGLDNTKSSHLDIYTRSNVADLACTYDVPGCQDQVKTIFDKWMSNPSVNLVDANLKTMVYCTGVETGGEAEWEFVLQQYKESTLAAESNRLLYALSCSKQTWLLSRYLEVALDTSVVRKQDASSVIVYISQNTVGRDLVWSFVRQNFDRLRRDYGGGSFSFSRLILGITESFNTDVELQQLRNFIKGKDFGSATRAAQQAIEKTQANIEWMEKNVPIIRRWLDRTTPTPQVNRNVRLPRSVLPELYTLELFPDLYKAHPKDFTFSGSLKILVNCTESTRNITLHSNKITIDTASVEVRGVNGGGNLFSSLSRQEELMFSIFHLNSDLTPGQQYELKMNFTGPLKDDLAGLYYSTYTSNNETKYLATTQMEPVDARKSFPCFDEPDMKAMFKVTLVRRNDYKSLSNMEIKAYLPRSGNLVADEYYVTPRMSTYLLAFIVCQFESTTTVTKNGIKYSAWSLPEAVNDTEFGLMVGNKTITYYEEYFNISFPLKKQDMIAIPDFSAGAMENWGLITYRETAMLFKPGVSSEGNRQRVTTVITHELAHQWFGNLVTMKWWDDLWLNEGFATFVECMGADHLFPEWKMWDQFVLDELYGTFSIDAFVTSHPIYVPVKTVAEMESVFDTISYSKGGSIIRMMRFFLGEENFRKGLYLYLESRKYGNAFHDDLWDAMDSVVVQKNLDYPGSIKEIMHTWILQMNYPVVTVTIPQNGVVRATQQRFLRNPEAKDPLVYISPFGYKWWVPLTYTTGTDNNFNKDRADVKWFNTTSKDFGDQSVRTSDWIIANTNQYGVYRVNYTQDNWIKLINQLKQNHSVISTINRAQIINDAWSFARSNQLHMDIALQTVDYLSNERDYIPRVAADEQLAYIESMLSLTQHYGNFQNKMQRLVRSIYNEIGLNNTGATHLQSYMRSHVAGTACSYDIPECLTAAAQQFANWMNNPGNNRIDPGLKYTVYCAAIKQGGQREWDFAYNQYKTSQVASERAKLLGALSCTKVPWLLKRFLEYAVTDGEVRKQDGTSVISSVGSNVIGRPIAWNFVRSRWNYIMKEYSEGQWNAGGFIKSISGAFNNDYQLQQLLDFGKVHRSDLGRAVRSYEQAVEAVQANIQWVQKNLNIVISWLNLNA